MSARRRGESVSGRPFERAEQLRLRTLRPNMPVPSKLGEVDEASPVKAAPSPAAAVPAGANSSDGGDAFDACTAAISSWKAASLAPTPLLVSLAQCLASRNILGQSFGLERMVLAELEKEAAGDSGKDTRLERAHCLGRLGALQTKMFDQFDASEASVEELEGIIHLLDDADRDIRESIAITKQVLGDDAEVGSSLLELARVKSNRGISRCGGKSEEERILLLQEADDQFEAAASALERQFGRRHRCTLGALDLWAINMGYMGRVTGGDPAANKHFVRALALARRTIVQKQKTLGYEDADTTYAALVLAGLEVEAGDAEIGAKLALEARRRFTRSHGADHPKTESASYWFVRSGVSEERCDEIEHLCTPDGIGILKPVPDSDDDGDSDGDDDLYYHTSDSD